MKDFPLSSVVIMNNYVKYYFFWVDNYVKYYNASTS